MQLQESIPAEKVLHEKGFRAVAGIDEAGRGPLAGPVVAAAVVLSPGWSHPDITDSKKLTAKKRQALFHLIQENAVTWNWAFADASEIDRINILRASLQAMKRAVERLAVQPEYLIVDGPHAVPSELPQTPIPHGDSRSTAIAAASIMAKVIRDAIMQKYHRLYPRYHFNKNKGYGTREHVEALRTHGHCPIHRVTFKKVVPADET